MDLELEELQKLFEQTQNAKAKVRLSERNVVELVSKLQALKLLDNDLLHTVSGKEYITQVRGLPFPNSIIATTSMALRDTLTIESQIVDCRIYFRSLARALPYRVLATSVR